MEILPARQQSLWRLPAVVNFAFGGLGAGFYLISAAAGLFGSPAMLRVAGWLAPAFVLAGFGAVALEAGRPFRGPRVLTRVRTSWMSRELALGGLFIASALLELARPTAMLRPVTAFAALAFVLSQGSMLREARGVPAWSAPVMPVFFLMSALISGTGLGFSVTILMGQPPRSLALGGTLLVLVAGMVVWLALLTWSDDPQFRRATAPLRDGGSGIELCGLGYVLPFALISIAFVFPPYAPIVSAVAAISMMAGQFRAKSALILRAGHLRSLTLSLRSRHAAVTSARQFPMAREP